MYLKPAATLLALAYADPLQLSHAERIEQADLEKDSDVMADLVLNAQFHRVMIQKGDDGMIANGRRQNKAVLAALVRNRRMRASAAVADRPGVPTARSVLSGGVSPAECDPLATEEGGEQQPVDVGILSYSGCGEEGQTCVESTSSSLGGVCVSSDQVDAASGRLLQEDPDVTPEEDPDVPPGEDPGFCPTGCPADVCACFGAETLDESCFDTIVGSCQDGSFLSSCYANDADSQAYGQLFCGLYECLHEKEINPVSGEPCSGDADCYEAVYSCYCDYYEDVCTACESGELGEEVCEFGGVGICDVATCCEQYGTICLTATAGPTAEGQTASPAPTYEPTPEEPTAAAPTAVPDGGGATPAPSPEAEVTPAPAGDGGEGGPTDPETPPPAPDPAPSAASMLTSRNVLMASIGCVLAPLLLFQRGF